jgi:putative oxidoreductase
MIKDLFVRYNPERSLPDEVVMTVLRVTAGLSMAFGHGHAKIKDPSMLIQGLTAMNFPAPDIMGWLVAIAEFIGGIFLAVGLLTRPSAGAIAVVMATAFFMVHAADPFGKKELALLYLVVMVLFFFRGAGAWSIDRFLDRK